MTFDIHECVFDAHGEYLEEAALRYHEELLDLFTTSPEGQELVRQGGTMGWADTFLDLGMSYLGATPPEMTPEQLQTILFELFPRKVSAEPGCGEEIIQALRAFWIFAQREFGLAHASACLRLLTAGAARRLNREMQNPANFGLAKSFLTLGLGRGFDVRTPEGVQAWVATYNAELRAAAEAPLPRPRAQASHATKTDAVRRKMAQQSRRKNRKKR